MYRTTVTLSAPPLDTFLDMRQWNKGVVFVNGFNVGRYWSVGPQRTLYVPTPLLVQGDNQFQWHPQPHLYCTVTRISSFSKSLEPPKFYIDASNEQNLRGGSLGIARYQKLLKPTSELGIIFSNVFLGWDPGYFDP
ncbi:hypothetical protein HAZT_HAZT000615 [Hyalella azteca]|uniref:Beta-galactosidase galactose-binding domain-containing protein n=1 Tax=Hyalella azteca TaxID=294128 RepID=A0A6A0GU64_HYAAZ|nr:hypothetical protein HAZT_HAZT000615 [Hyalella azteca]